MKKRILALLAAMVLFSLLCACTATLSDVPSEDSEFEVGESAKASEPYDFLQNFSCQ